MSDSSAAPSTVAYHYSESYGEGKGAEASKTGEGNSWESEKRKCLAHKGCSASRVSLLGEKVISGKSYLPDTGPLSNVFH